MKHEIITFFDGKFYFSFMKHIPAICTQTEKYDDIESNINSYYQIYLDNKI